jgi:aminoglycoside phosphotransferase (APT) family kinase protein
MSGQIEAYVPDDVIRTAIGSGLANPSLGSPEQWAAVQSYLDGRGDDPWPQRRALLAAGEVSRDRLQEWLASDVAIAAPLMGAFTSHDTDIEHADVTVPAREADLLAGWLSERAGEPVRVVGATVIGGGFSRRMWRVRVEQGGVERPIIVRIEQGGMFGTDTVTEVAVMRAVHGAGYSVPAVEDVETTGSVLGEPFFVMEQVPGVVRLDDQGLDDIIRSVADLHRVPVTVLDASGRTAEQVVSDSIEGWRRMYRAHSPELPLIEYGADWLHEHLAPTGPSVIVHGDAGPGNALFDPERGLTTIDWEFAHVGVAAEDWAYLALIRGRRIMDGDAWKARLRTVAGIDYSPEQWRTWLAFMHLSGACVNLSARSVFERGPRRTADQLAIGVAVHLRSLSQLTEITCP